MGEMHTFRSWNRRTVLGSMAVSAASAVLAACGTENAPTTLPPATTSAAVSGSSVATLPPVTTGAGRATVVATMGTAGGRMRGELRLLLGVEFPTTVDATKSGFQLCELGVAEGLTRIMPDGKVAPWLAESVTNVNPTTWRVTLRRNAKFHDGTPVDADAVIAAFRKNWETQPAADGLLSKETRIIAEDALTLRFESPRPIGNFPNALAAQTFMIHKGGGTVMTGPYRPVRFETDKELVGEAFPDHWAGPPALARVITRYIPDANARLLALQSGDVDMLFLMPPEMLRALGPDYDTQVVNSTRVHAIKFNHARPPFNDRALREATAYAIDRKPLLDAVMDGKGAIATGPFPQDVGVQTIPVQASDPTRARSLLDAAGWRVGPDGVRVKDGGRLAFTLYSYPQRGELTPMATAIQAQLKPLGYDIAIQQVQNIGDLTRKGEYSASMTSLNTLVTGDPQYLYNNTLATGGANNDGKFTSAPLDALLDRLRVEPEPAKRDALHLQMLEVVRAEVPGIYLVVMPIIIAARKGRVRNLVAHPNDQYLLTPDIAVS